MNFALFFAIGYMIGFIVGAIMVGRYMYNNDYELLLKIRMELRELRQQVYELTEEDDDEV